MALAPKVSSAVIAVGRSQVRRQAGGWLAVALLICVGGGITLTAAAAARRTSSVTTRFLRQANAADLVVDYDGPISFDGLPGVAARSRSVGFGAFWIHGGRADLAGIDQVIASVDGRYLSSERPALKAGHLPDPNRRDQAFIDVNTARATGLGVGDRVELGVVPAGAPIDDLSVAVRQAHRATVTIVGVAVMTDEVVQDDLARSRRLVLTPAFYRSLRKPTTTFTQTALHLTPAASVGTVQREVSQRVERAVAAGKAQRVDDLSFADQRDIAARAVRAIRPTAIGLGLFALATALVTVLVAGQGAARLIGRDAADVPTLRALGFTSRKLMAASAAGPVISAGIGVLGALVLAWLLSPVGPVGPGRRVEPDPGLHADALALGIGTAIVLALVLVRMGASIAVNVPAIAAARRVDRGDHALMVGARRAGPVAAVGVGLALGPGAGRGGTARPALVGIAASVAFFVLAVTFGAGLGQLVHQPRRYGWNWDVALELGSGYGRLDGGGTASSGAITRTSIRRVPGVEAASSARFEVLGVGGSAVPALGVRSFVGRVDLAMASGRSPATTSEVALGAATARRLHAGPGDRVPVRAGSRSRLMRVTGIAVFPGLGRVDTQRTGLGEGVELTGAGLDALVPCRTYAGGPCVPGGGDNALVIRYAAHADRAIATASLRKRYQDAGLFISVLGPQRSADVVDYQQLVTTTSWLAVVLAAAALATLAGALTATARGRRHDFAVLKSVGFTPLQVSATIGWQAFTVVVVAGVIGTPLGIAAGRELWSVFAREAGVLPDPVTPLLVIVAAIALALLLACLIALPAAVLAGRTSPAVALRST